MNSPFLGMLVAGVLFSIWPIIMSKSGLSGMASTAVFIVMSMTIIVPAAMSNGVTLQSVAGAKGVYALIAAAIASVGLILMNRSLGAADPQQIGSLLLVMVLAQVAVPALYQIWVGALTMKLVGGIVAAVVAIILLLT